MSIIKVCSICSKICYWVVYWGLCLNWVVLLQAKWMVALQDRVSYIITTGVLAAIGGMLREFFYAKTGSYQFNTSKNQMFSFTWGTFWLVIHFFLALFSPGGCAGSYTCWDLGVLFFILFVILFVLPVIFIYTAFVGVLGDKIHNALFR